MMNTILRPYFIFALLVTILGLLLGPAVAQRPQPQGKPGGFSGRILEVNARQRAVKLALYVPASPDAPGKAPLMMAQKAASLNAQADLAEKNAAAQGDPQKKERYLQRAAALRNMATRLLSWREVEYNFTLSNDQSQLTGMRKAQLSEVTKGTHLRLEVTIPRGPAPAAGEPMQVVLASDAFQLGREIPLGIQQPGEEFGEKRGGRHGDGRGDFQYFVIIGEVVQSSPMVVKVNERVIQVANPNRMTAWTQVPLTPRDFQPGLQVRALANMRGPMEIDSINRLYVFLDRIDFPFVPTGNPRK
ncbi:MAG: hypothetical protein ACYC7E_07120 [Armatimonadota bacterium]